jgi:hypothetical protein
MFSPLWFGLVFPKKTGCRRRNVSKENLVAEDPVMGSSGELFWAQRPITWTEEAFQEAPMEVQVSCLVLI